MQLEEEFQLIGERSSVQCVCRQSDWISVVRTQRLTTASLGSREQLTNGTAELFKVDEAVLVLINQAKDPEGQGVLGGAKSPRLEQGEEHTKLVET